jgi:hypothetical protein
MARIYPELVHGRLDGFEQGRWVVERGEARRGGASCDLSRRLLRVPDGADSTSRVVRAHELMHIRVSPHRSDHLPTQDIPARAVECAEEFRVNTLLGRLEFDLRLLRDGSEKRGAQRLAESGDWSEAVFFYLAVLGTGAESDFLRGLRTSHPTWASALRAVKKAVLALVEPLTTDDIGDTCLSATGVPRGVETVTIPVARLAARSMGSRPPEDADGLRVFRRSLEPGARRAPSGRFAQLVWDESLEYTARPRVRAHRRRRASAVGTVMRYPSRLLLDPLCRAFAQSAPARGGIVVIDQSGSMDVTTDDLHRLLRGAPESLIVGYSHRPGDGGATPNAWVLADAGRVANNPPTGNVGNGVDGLILRWAIRRAQGSETIVWVTDGQVTDSHDHPCHRLSVECAALVRRSRIVLVRTLDEIPAALRGRRSPAKSFGRVGRELQHLPRY